MIAKIGKHTEVDAWFCYTIDDDGCHNYHVINETYEVASAVADAINHPERWEPTEAYEIAETIRRQP